MSLLALSTELQQTILGYLDFISLLNIRNTNTTFQDLVNTSLSKSGIILPTRVKLLQLYQEPHLSPLSIASFSDNDSDEEAEPFNGEEYLATLRTQIAQHAPGANLKIPAEFEHWVLEWPQHAILSFTYFAELEENGEKLFASEDAEHRLSYLSAEDDAEPVGIYVGYHGCTIYTTLFFEGGVENVRERGGKVWTGDVCYMAELEEWSEDEDLAGSWTEWLRRSR